MIKTKIMIDRAVTAFITYTATSITGMMEMRKKITLMPLLLNNDDIHI
jgi:hypothetical protein